MTSSIAQLEAPLTLPCGLVLQNRICKAAMAENMADLGDRPSEVYQKVYIPWSEGKYGIVMPGNVMVSERDFGSPKDLYVKHDLVGQQEYVKAWARWADTVQRGGAKGIVQLCHPGRQSPMGAGKRGMFAKALAPSAIPLNFNSGLLARLVRSLVFGTPRALSTAEVTGIIDNFVSSAKLMHAAGFAGIELHAAHGYLLAQFMSPHTNVRTDEFGGSPLKRVEIVTRIIRETRKATGKDFCIGIKLNSADVQAGDSLEDVLMQVGEIVMAGVDFIEISGGTYEKARMMVGDEESKDGEKTTAVPQQSERTKAREAFFLEFAGAVQKRHPDVVLMVTGGFRSRKGMAEAIEQGVGIVGIGRPAAVNPYFPRDVLFNEKVGDDEAFITLRRPEQSSLLNLLGLKFVGAGMETAWYGGLIRAFVRIGGVVAA